MKATRVSCLVLAAGCVAAATGWAAAETAINPPKDGNHPLPAPVAAKAGEVVTYPTLVSGLPPVIYGDLNDRDPRDTSLNVPTPLFTPSGMNEPYKIMDQGVDSYFPTIIHRFDAQGPNGLTPPDPDIAVGPNHIGTVTNDDYVVYDKCGNVVFSRDANDLFGIDTSFLLFDPKIIFDPWQSKWVVMFHCRRDSDQTGQLVVAVSNTSDPVGVGNWYFYRFNIVQDAGTANASWPDYFDLGYSDDYVYSSGNMFTFGTRAFRWGRFAIWPKSTMYSAGGVVTYNHFNFTNPDGSTMETPRSVKCQSAFSTQDAVFINSRGGGGNRLTIHRIADVVGTNTRTSVDVPVADYNVPPDAPQPNGQLLDIINCRLMIATQANDNVGAGGTFIWTGLNDGEPSAGGLSACRMIRVNAGTNVVDGLDANLWAANFSYWFPSAGVDYTKSAFYVFTRVGNSGTNFAEVRAIDIVNGANTNSSNQVWPGSGNYGGVRWGDYLGAQLDWGDYLFAGPSGEFGEYAKVWMVGEYAVPGDWGTAVGVSSVRARGVLTGSPVTPITISGPQGGPFTISGGATTLDNTGAVGLTVNGSTNVTWLSASPAQAQLYPPSNVVGNVATTVAANGLAVGSYTGTVTYADCYQGGASVARTVNLAVRPRNDACTGATVIGNGSFLGSTINSTSDFGNVSSCAGTADLNDVWYRYNASCSGTVTVTTCAASTNFDTTLSVFSRCNGTEIACNDDALCSFSNLRSQLSFNVEDGGSYLIRVSGFNGQTGNFQMTVSAVPCAADFNGDCTVDFFDYLDFAQAYAVEDPAADFNSDGQVDFFDYLDFAAAFDSGC
ncbi:MAG: hypothetical protein SFZ23_14750 [Planctomycetota bacterium]|nr:hypothetical protein [Planctomycetota bacterium]